MITKEQLINVQKTKGMSLMPKMIFSKQYLQSTIIQSLTPEELNAIKNSVYKDSVVQKLANLASASYLQEPTPENLFVQAMSIGTILKEYGWGIDFIKPDGLFKLAKLIEAAMDADEDSQKSYSHDAYIYLAASKTGLLNRTEEYLQAIEENAKEWRISLQGSSFDKLCSVIVNNAHNLVVQSGWDVHDTDGVSWFIGSLSDIVVKAELYNNYNQLFLNSFDEYFQSY